MTREEWIEEVKKDIESRLAGLSPDDYQATAEVMSSSEGVRRWR